MSEKKFTKEDLELVKDDDSDKDDDKKPDRESESDSSAEEKSKKESRDTPPSKSGEPRSSIFDDSDDDDEVEKDTSEVEKPVKADNDGDEKPAKDQDPVKEDDKEEKPKEVDWRDNFISRVLKGKETELTAAKLEKRREALKKQLGRYKTQEDYMLAGLSAQEKIRSGEFRRAKLADDASEEEVSEWRRDNGIPEKPESYDIPKIAGHKWTEEDSPFIDSFKKVAHEANIDQGQLNRFADWYARNLSEQQDTYLEKLASNDRQDMESLEDGLRSELGTDFRPVSKLVQRLMKDNERGVGDFSKELREARYIDEEGNYRRLINHPKMTRFLVGLALETYGDAALIDGDAKGGTSNRLKEIEDIRDNNIDDYWRKGLDKEYADLLEKQDSATHGRRRVRA